MSLDQMQQALLDAHREQLKKEFGVLIANLATDEANAEKHFAAAVRLNKRAFEIATAVCTKLLGD
jgi:hypothetical protein